MAGLISRFRTACLCTALIACHTATAVPLWEIEGTDNRIRLLGSVHFLRADDYPLPGAIDDAYRDADVIVMELALDEISPTEMQRAFEELAIDPHGRKLDKLIGTRIWRKAQTLSSAIDIDLGTLQLYEPWFAALQITQIRLRQLGFDGTYGIEKTISRKARDDRKPLLGLETLDEQLRALDTLPEEAQQSFLLQTLEDANSIAAELDTIVTAWRHGDIEILEELLLEGMDEQPDIYDQVLVQRNRRWTNSIIDMMNDPQDYLIIVGTLHLIGEDSVQNMLEEAGIQTRRIR